MLLVMVSEYFVDKRDEFYLGRDDLFVHIVVRVLLLYASRGIPPLGLD